MGRPITQHPIQGAIFLTQIPGDAAAFLLSDVRAVHAEPQGLHLFVAFGVEIEAVEDGSVDLPGAAAVGVSDKVVAVRSERDEGQTAFT